MDVFEGPDPLGPSWWPRSFSRQKWPKQFIKPDIFDLNLISSIAGPNYGVFGWNKVYMINILDLLYLLFFFLKFGIIGQKTFKIHKIDHISFHDIAWHSITKILLKFSGYLVNRIATLSCFCVFRKIFWTEPRQFFGARSFTYWRQKIGLAQPRNNLSYEVEIIFPRYLENFN